jgi:hypothetical protein
MLDDILRQAFTRARQRAGLIFLDILWKAIWLIATTAALLLIAAWFASDLRAIAWADTGVPALNVWMAATALRELWEAIRGEVFWTVSGVLLLSALGWLSLEAFARSRIIDRSKTKLFFASAAAKAVSLLAGAVILVPVCIAGAAVLATILFLALAFSLTLLDTLIRGDAVELLGTDLIRVTGLILVLMSFETMVGASFAVILIAGFLRVARLADAIVMLGAAGACIVILNLLHSYLLLVRFSAVDIMSGE